MQDKQGKPLNRTIMKGSTEAIERYKAFMAEGKSQPALWEQHKNQIYLGTDVGSKMGHGEAFGTLRRAQ
jgi:tetrahydromethanopterin S-methyltransferase subunit H